MLLRSHAPRERVSWNDRWRAYRGRTYRSRSTWACELKWKRLHWFSNLLWSRSTWACELKLDSVLLSFSLNRHAPRERVSWNLMFSSKQHVIPVTLHVSVWVEMTFLLLLLTFLRRHAPRERVSWNVLIRLKFAQRGVTLHVSVWVEMTNSNGKPFLFTGHAPRERVSWNLLYFS